MLTQKEIGNPGTTTFAYKDTEEGGVEIIADDGNGGHVQILTDKKGQKIKTVDVSGAVTEYLYDKNGNLLDETDSYGNTSMYQYDEKGNMTAVYDTAGKSAGPKQGGILRPSPTTGGATFPWQKML